MRRECRERFSHHRLQRKPLVNDPGMHHGTYETHVPWCMSWSLTRGGAENVPGIPGAWATRNCTHLVRSPLMRFHYKKLIFHLVCVNNKSLPFQLWFDREWWTTIYCVITSLLKTHMHGARVYWHFLIIVCFMQYAIHLELLRNETHKIEEHFCQRH